MKNGSISNNCVEGDLAKIPRSFVEGKEFALENYGCKKIFDHKDIYGNKR